MSVLPALQGVKGPVGGTRCVGLGEALGEVVGVDGAVGVGLVVSDGLGVGAAIAGPEKSATDRDVTAKSAVEILR